MDFLSGLYFILMIVFLVLWLSGRGKHVSRGEIDKESDSYAQGYWEGYKVRKAEEVTGNFEVEAYFVEQTGSSGDIKSEINDATELTKGFDYEMESIVTDSEIDQAELKAKHDLQNINTVLYVASFLLVAAVALFIGTSLPESVRFVGVWVVTALFYIIGLYLHRRIEKLRPAAVAFVGTGLAILPFTGIAMYNLVLADASICWFVTSIIGVLTFVYAAVSLRSQVVAYLALAFMVSMATSSVATLGAGLIWYFVVLIGFGSLMTFISMLKPSWISPLFLGPIQASNQWIVPLTIAASLLSFMALRLTDYWVILLISAVYYGAVAASSRDARGFPMLSMRLLSSLAVILMVLDFSDSWKITSVTISIVGILQIVLSSILHKNDEVDIDVSYVCSWLGFLAQVIAPLFVLGDSSWGLIASGQLFAMAVMGFLFSASFKKPELSAFSIFAIAVLPILIGLKVVSPSLDSYLIALIFTILTLISVGVMSIFRSTKKLEIAEQLSIISGAIFAIEALVFTSNISAGWGVLIWAIVAIVAYYVSYVQRLPWLNIISNGLFAVTALWALTFIGVPGYWRWPVVSWIAVVVFYGVYYWLAKSSRKSYATCFWWSSVIVGLLVNLVGLVGSNITTDGVLITSLSALCLLFIAGVIIIKGNRDKIYGFVDLGVIIGTVALQRLVGLHAEGLNFLVYTHWWAVMIAILAYFYYSLGLKSKSKTRIIIALSFVTVFSGIMALISSVNIDNVPYRAIFLVEHILILISGLYLSRKLYTIWGAVGVTLAILWMLSGMTYILLAFAALVLICIAIYALTKPSKL